jgi:hypothetical protein
LVSFSSRVQQDFKDKLFSPSPPTDHNEVKYDDNVAVESVSGSVWDSVASAVMSVSPEPWREVIEALKRDLASFRSHLDSKIREWDSERAHLSQELNATRLEVQALGEAHDASCDAGVNEGRWKMVQGELVQLRAEIAGLRDRLVKVESRKR